MSHFYCIVCLPMFLLNLVTGIEAVFLSCFFRNQGGGVGVPYISHFTLPLLYFCSSLTPACLSSHSIAGTAVLLGVAVPTQSAKG